MKPFGYTAGFAATGIATVAFLLCGLSLSAQAPASRRAVALSLQPGETADDLLLPPGAYRIADGVVGPVPRQKVAPGWSPEAKLARLEGTAIVTGVIGADGLPRDMRVTCSAGPGLDEKALEAIAGWKFIPATYFDQPIPVFASIAIDFRFPAGASRWHLTEAKLDLPEGASRPVFRSVLYPAGAGVSPDAVEEGQLVGASGRTALATVQFDIDERGVPVHFQVRSATADIWGSEAIRVLRLWRFKPGVKDGRAISIPSTFTFAWGSRELQPSREATLPYVPDPPAVLQRGVHPPIVSRVEPIYSLDAQLAGVEGTVELALFVDENGNPHDIHVTESLGHGLDEAALAAVSTWKFRPILLNGRAEPVPAVIRVDFHSSPPAPRRK